MKLRLLSIILISFLFANRVYAQKMKMQIINGDTIYFFPPSEGDKCYERGDIKGAVDEYRKQIKKDPFQINVVAHNFACALCKNGEPDSAFRYLYIDLNNDTSALVLTDPDLLPLRNEKAWPAFHEAVVTGLKKKYSKQVTDFPLAEKLWEMGARDQAYYYEIHIAEAKLGRKTPVVMALWNAKEELNRQNQIELDSIIKAHGWPKISEVGHNASGIAFLVIQHSNLDLQEKYLPTIKALCDQKEADWESYALMYDRIQIGHDRPQLYGSQLRYNEKTKKNEFFPIEDEKNVDKRRAEIGMMPLEDYAARFGVKYTLPK